MQILIVDQAQVRRLLPVADCIAVMRDTLLALARGKPGEKYTAEAEFTPTGASTSNFVVTKAATFRYTGSESDRPTPTSSAPAEAEVLLPTSSALTLPGWSIALAVLAILGLAGLVSVFALRLFRATRVVPTLDAATEVLP